MFSPSVYKVRTFFLFQCWFFCKWNYVIHFSLSENSSNVNTLLMSTELISLSTTRMIVVHLSRDHLSSCHPAFERTIVWRNFDHLHFFHPNTGQITSWNFNAVHWWSLVEFHCTFVCFYSRRNLDGLGLSLRNRKLWKKTRRGHVAHIPVIRLTSCKTESFTIPWDLV